MFFFENALHWSEYVKLLVGLLAMVDVIGAIFIFEPLTSRFDPRQKRQVAFVAALATAIALLLFAFFGTHILNFFGISIHAFRIAGGLLILVSGLEMLRSGGIEIPETNSESQHISIAVTPLAIPFLAGPGAVTSVIVYSHLKEHPTLSHEFLIALVILAVSLLAYIAMRAAPLLSKRIGKTGIEVFNRVMGLVISAIAVEFIAEGAIALFPGLAG